VDPWTIVDSISSGLSDGTYGSPENDGMDRSSTTLLYQLTPLPGNMGVVYNLNLTMTFDQTTNLTSLFKPMSKPNNIPWSFNDGAMFVNDNEFILYGYSDTESSYPLTMLMDVRGLFSSLNSSGSPAVNWILGYEQDQDGPESINWIPSFIQNSLPDGFTRYIAGGGAVSAPSENLSFYFSGVREQNWGVITDNGQLANVTANTLITVNMPTMSDQTWSNNTLPDNIPGRINAELVWIPVSQSGVLIAIGGVVHSDVVTWAISLTATQAAASVSLSAVLTFSFFSHGG
jgi:hypothetical protein